MAQMVKNLPAKLETWVQFLGLEDSIPKMCKNRTFSHLKKWSIIACYMYLLLFIH